MRPTTTWTIGLPRAGARISHVSGICLRGGLVLAYRDPAGLQLPQGLPAKGQNVAEALAEACGKLVARVTTTAFLAWRQLDDAQDGAIAIRLAAPIDHLLLGQWERAEQRLFVDAALAPVLLRMGANGPNQIKAAAGLVWDALRRTPADPLPSRV